MNKELEFYNIFVDLKVNGKECKPRGLKIIEIENFSYKLSPYNRFCNFESRKLSLKYIKDEFKWYLTGDLHDISIAEKAAMWKTLINKDGTINSNYGHYIFSSGSFYRVAEELIEDEDSRRGSIVILSNVHFNNETKDIPCTYSLNFRIRNGRLNMSVCMRSQDAIFGMGNDAPSFSFIHEMMFVYLRDTYPWLKYGEYFHYCNSFHIYEKHFEMLDKITKGDNYTKIDCPRISCKEEVRFLINHNFNNIPEEYKFAQWLNS